MYLIFDTETTGLPRDYRAPLTDFDNWPRVVQISWQLLNSDGSLDRYGDYIIRPDGFDIPFNAAAIHGITTEKAQRLGVPLQVALNHFLKDLEDSNIVVGHNIEFDINILGCELLRLGIDTGLTKMPTIDTTHAGTDFCKLPGGRGGGYKYPKLDELHQALFKKGFGEAHNAIADVEATARCFVRMCELGLIETTPPLKQGALKNLEQRAVEILAQITKREETETAGLGHSVDANSEADLTDSNFVHLNVHSQFSVLQSTISIKELVKKVAESGMKAVGLTDTQSLYGSFEFLETIAAHNHDKDEEARIKGIVGCEMYVCKDMRSRKSQDNGNVQLLLAKNKVGYYNLSKLSSQSFTEGYYYVPRIDRELLAENKEGLMALSGGLYAEIPWLLLNVGERQAEEAFLWWREQFGEDFYLQLQDHGLPEERHVNQFLISLSEKYGTKCIVANAVYYLGITDHQAHDVLLCIKEGERRSTPIGRGRGFRLGLPNSEYFFKSPKEMKQLFKDYPQAIDNISELVDKCEYYTLEREVMLPKFDIPEEFKDPQDEADGGKRGENNYLRHLTYEGAAKRYGTIAPEIAERLDFELQTIANTGYPGYFLIVQDFTSKARELGVAVGPGRGSAAGSAVAYCIGITNVDPIKYNLLFERFLNPERVSLPDIDIDFDDEGRGLVIDYVVQKYGADQVAQIVTYGTMGAKSAVRDAGRVMEFPLSETDMVAKKLPNDLELNELLDADINDLKKKVRSEEFENIKWLRNEHNSESPAGSVLRLARKLEGSIRNTGIHACGVIITPQKLVDITPVFSPKDSNLLATQFDNSVVEKAGMLKMDFLGLKTLTILKEAVKLIKERRGIAIDLDEIPFDDQLTYELFQRAETIGLFQFESAGMQKHLKDLQPDRFEDLIAMNALYRPGPMEYIPDYVARKHGKQQIAYDLPEMEEYLEETYGITVYQEQVMLLSQKLAGFSKGQADVLRKAMGKKQRHVLDKLKTSFLEGCESKGFELAVCEKIWKDWEAFAEYAFNKSHSTCYSVLAYQTGYLKANYPQEYMAAVLTHNMSDIKKVSFFMGECKRMRVPVLGPDVNESAYNFTVNKAGAIRFGMGAVKGLGQAAVENIIQDRNQNGPFEDIFDLAQRVDLRQVNKRSLESLAVAGAFDAFQNGNRAVFITPEGDGTSWIEKAIRYGQQLKKQEDTAQVSLFGDVGGVEVSKPEVPTIPRWNNMMRLKKEREVVGIYISAHPLDDVQTELRHTTNTSLESLSDPAALLGKDLRFGALVMEAQHRVSKTGKKWGSILLEDMLGSFEFNLFSEDYQRNQHFIQEDLLLWIRGTFDKNEYTGKDGISRSEIRFKVREIKLLNEILDKGFDKVKIEFELKQLDTAFYEKLFGVLNKFKGKQKYEINVFDTEDKLNLSLPSKSRGVRIGKELLQALDEIPKIRVQIQ